MVRKTNETVVDTVQRGVMLNLSISLNNGFSKIFGRMNASGIKQLEICCPFAEHTCYCPERKPQQLHETNPFDNRTYTSNDRFNNV